jgi:hypothetical protein
VLHALLFLLDILVVLRGLFSPGVSWFGLVPQHQLMVQQQQAVVLHEEKSDLCHLAKKLGIAG